MKSTRRASPTRHSVRLSDTAAAVARLWVPEPRPWRRGASWSSELGSTLYRLVAGLAGPAIRSGRRHASEIIVLRHEFDVSRRQVDRPAPSDEDRTLLGAIAQALPRRLRPAWLVTPDTLVCRHRRRVTRHWAYSSSCKGRPPAAVMIQQLLVQMAAENPMWVQPADMRRNHRPRTQSRSTNCVADAQEPPGRRQPQASLGDTDTPMYKAARSLTMIGWSCRARSPADQPTVTNLRAGYT
jgi:hypothetical protein